jgi:tRNA(Ile)-lysidine synthase
MTEGAYHRGLAEQVATRARALLEGVAGPYVVAVSGGADSTALAGLLAEAGIGPLVLAHVDHGWRGPEAAQGDRAHVEALATRLGARFACAPPPAPPMPQTEDAARRHRYAALTRIAEATGASVVFVGHHAKDQAETLVARALRGAGAVGLAGIPPARPLGRSGLRVLRPLLEIGPGRLRSWLGDRGIAWVEDVSNEDTTRERAAIRQRLSRTGLRQADVEDWMGRLARRLRTRLAWKEARLLDDVAAGLVHRTLAECVSISRAWLRDLRTPLEFALALRHAGHLIHADRDGPWTTSRHRARMWALVESGGDLDLPRNLRFHVAGKRAWLGYRTYERPPVPEWEMDRLPRAAFDLAAHLAQTDPRCEAALSGDLVGASPRLRWLAPGDTFVPFGQGARSPVDIHRWMSRHGLPHFVRRGTLVLEGDHGIGWVVGERIDARHAVRPATEQVVRIRLPRLTSYPACSRHHPAGRSAPS